MAPILLALATQTSTIARRSILPQDTDRAITEFQSNHSVFIDNVAKPRGELLVFLPGTNGKTNNTDNFCKTAASLGYQVINLMYPDDVPATKVRSDKDRKAFENFRLEIITGEDLSKAISVNRSNSIEHRLIKLLQHLDKSYPSERWGAFLTSKSELNWPQIAVSGLSQGAGHAGLIATRRRVARAILFGGPKDYDRAVDKPAGWIGKTATPTDLIFTFNHEQDLQGCDLSEQLEICRAMGLEEHGKAVDVDKVVLPFKGSRILTTDFPGTKVPSVQAHGSVVGDGSKAKLPNGKSLFEPVWVYMLTRKD
ncbi:MAG: hypothetical protein JNK63_05605 [Chthonomonas sp.]|nr:hypothetical protein [Chthonomonas sp.]